MQGLITVDFGNSHPHAGLFQKNGGEWQFLKSVPWNELALFTEPLGFSPNNSSIVLSEVKPREDELFHWQKQGYLLTRVKDYWRGKKFAGMPVNYQESLGQDRLIEAFYCFKKEKISSLIIDAGTFTTMDVVTTEGFQGGYIFPSFEKYSQLFQAGENLKNRDLQLTSSLTLPSETNAAMAQSYSAFFALAQELINRHQIKKVTLTGGKSSSWEALFRERKGDWVVETSPHLIHSALHYWMTTQIEPQ